MSSDSVSCSLYIRSFMGTRQVDLGQVARLGQTARVQRPLSLHFLIIVAVNSKGLWVGCPIVRASDEHCFIVRVLRAQGHPPMASRFLSPPSRYVVT